MFAGVFDVFEWLVCFLLVRGGCWLDLCGGF